ncbi:hypothetical protein BJ085DRAFT_37244 [Dimargaris cristalligena]|uniref:Uncharacterized protein n=1 Tax=Dimargaris cristalligena TaxID=215637 RepID=A0A4Q0A444_9FUNG|nr:hypothetical protein BJ085DRAFT_37244 [Dimargaris cristalligena]|eukprot:RKP40351.1 hypothetical protein BJ085DRAFT_37244 [Dimargaris cristalligena]
MRIFFFVAAFIGLLSLIHLPAANAAPAQHTDSRTYAQVAAGVKKPQPPTAAKPSGTSVKTEKPAGTTSKDGKTNTSADKTNTGARLSVR